MTYAADISIANTCITSIAGTVYIIPVFGGYIADSLAGKYNTILGSGFIYILGIDNYKHTIITIFKRSGMTKLRCVSNK